MNRFGWQHIEFSDGSNPYICKSEEEFKKVQARYTLKQIKYGFWLAIVPKTETCPLF